MLEFDGLHKSYGANHVMFAAIAVVVRLGGRIYAGALLRTGGKVKLREALSAEGV